MSRSNYGSVCSSVCLASRLPPFHFRACVLTPGMKAVQKFTGEAFASLFPATSKRGCSRSKEKGLTGLSRCCPNHSQRQDNRAGTETHSGRLFLNICLNWPGLSAKEHIETSQQKSLYSYSEASRRDDGRVVGIKDGELEGGVAPGKPRCLKASLLKMLDASSPAAERQNF